MSYIIDSCGSCQAPIIWVVTRNARRMPVNAEPSKDGNVALDARGIGTPLARVLNVSQRFGRSDLRTSHFVTCPQRDSWRRRR